MRERRKERRWRAYLGGRASFFKRQAATDCLIRNTSTAGAKLIVPRGQLIPDEFELTIPQRETVYSARVRWRSGEELGVELQPMKNAPIPLSLARRLKQAETENNDLKRRLAWVRSGMLHE